MHFSPRRTLYHISVSAGLSAAFRTAADAHPGALDAAAPLQDVERAEIHARMASLVAAGVSSLRREDASDGNLVAPAAGVPGCRCASAGANSKVHGRGLLSPGQPVKGLESAAHVQQFQGQSHDVPRHAGAVLRLVKIVVHGHRGRR